MSWYLLPGPKLPGFSDRYFRGTEVSGSTEVFTLQPFKDAHLYSDGLEYGMGRTASGSAVWSFLIIAFFILIFVPAYGTGNALSLRLDGENMESTIGFIETTYQDFFPGNIFEYAFVNETFQRLYEADRRFSRILTFFTLLTVLIACLGLFGLATYMTLLRTKEIGVRKVLGASVSSLLLLLSKDFLKLVLLALFIAIPIAWFFSEQWLMEFPYRVTIEWWMFAIAGLMAIVVAFLAVSAQSVKVALANPVKSIRSE